MRTTPTSLSLSNNRAAGRRAAPAAAWAVALAMVLGAGLAARAGAQEAGTGAPSPAADGGAAEAAGDGSAEPDHSWEQDADKVFARIESIEFNLHAVSPRNALADLTVLERLRTSRSFDARVLGLLARAYEQRAALDGDPIWAKRALEVGQRALGLNPNLAVTHSGYGWALMASARYGDPQASERRLALEQAALVFAQAAERGREKGWVDLCAKAMALADLGDTDGAIAAYKEAAVQNRLAWETYAGIAAVYRRRGTLAGAALWFERAARRADETAAYLVSDAARKEAEDDLDELAAYERDFRADALVRAPRAAAALLVRAAEAHAFMGALAEADKLLAELGQRGIAIPGADLLLARVRLAQGRADEAVAALGPVEAPSGGQRSAEWLALRGEALRSAGRLDEARVDLEAARRRLPVSALALAGIAELELTAGNVEEATRLADEALARDRYEPAFWRLSARAHEAAGDAAGAAQARQRGDSVEAELRAAWAEGVDIPARKWLRQATDWVSGHRYVEALAAVEPVVRGDPADLTAARCRAAALAGLDRDEALRAAEQALALAPTAIDLLLVAARAAIAADRLPLARDHALKAIAVAPKEAEVRRVLASIDIGSGTAASNPSSVREEVEGLLNEAEVDKRRARVEGLIRKGNPLPLLLHLPTEDNDAILATIIRALSGSTQEEARRSIESRALSLGPDKPQAQRASLDALASWKSATSMEALGALAKNAGSDDIRSRAQEALGELTVTTSLADLAVKLDPSNEHSQEIREAFERRVQQDAGADVWASVIAVLRYGSLGALPVLLLLWWRNRKRQREALELRAAARRRRPV